MCQTKHHIILKDMRLLMYMAMKDTVEGLTQSPVDYYHITYQTCVK